MPRRIAAVEDQTLLREVGHLSDEVLLLPRQVAFLTGLSVGMLAERLRTRPPKPPFPEPREKPRGALWYSLGSVRAYRSWLRDQTEAHGSVIYRLSSFAAWLDADPDEWAPLHRYPIALVGLSRRPVDVWQTVRGEVAMSRSDSIVWMTREGFSRERHEAEGYEEWWRGRLDAAASLGIVPGPRRRNVLVPIGPGPTVTKDPAPLR